MLEWSVRRQRTLSGSGTAPASGTTCRSVEEGYGRNMQRPLMHGTLLQQSELTEQICP
jgi:hypothetical protein